MILGRDLLQDLGIVPNFNDQTIPWDDSMKTMQEDANLLSIVLTEGKSIDDAPSQIKKLIKTKSEHDALDQKVQECTNPTSIPQRTWQISLSIVSFNDNATVSLMI